MTVTGADFPGLARSRPLAQMPDESTGGTGDFRDLAAILAGGTGDYYDVLLAVRDAFDIDTAVGDQLDKLGAIVGLSREGYADDARYRVLLGIQTELLLAAARADGEWTGTGANLLRIARAFVGTGDPIVLANIPPYEYSLSVPGVDVADALLLVRFLRIATWAGVRGIISVSLAADSLYGSEHGTVSGEGLWGSEHGAVAGEATWGATVVV